MPYVYQKLTSLSICNALLTDEYASWTFDQALALAEYLIECAESTGEPLEFNRVAVRCDFSPYTSAIEAAAIEYGQEPADEAAAIEYLEASTLDIIPCDDGSIIVRQF